MCLISVKELIKELVFFTISHTDENKDYLILSYLILPSLKVKRTLSPYFRNLPLLHITIRLHLIWRLLKFMQWLARKQYLLRRRTRQIRLNAVGRVKVGDNIIDL